MNALLQSALSYAKRGWRVFPLHHPTQEGSCSCGDSNCSAAAKHPRIRNWQHDATTSEARLHQWWKQWPEANIGIATGRQSNLIVVDLDGPLGIDNWRQVCQERGFQPTTQAVRTGRGQHLYFSCGQSNIPSSRGKIAPHVDVRGEGGYVVAAPSLHISGKQYQIEDERQPAPAPEWLTPERNALTDSPMVAEGQRNDTLFKLACALRGQHGMELEQIEAILLEFNREKCATPLSGAEVLRIAASASKYEPEQSPKSKKKLEETPLYWMKLRTKDFLADQNLNLMSDYQIGWWTRLTVFAWNAGGFLPADTSKLWKLAKAKSRRAFERDCDLVLHDFDEVDVNGTKMLRHPRMAAEYAATLEKWIQKRDAGEASRAAKLAAAQQATEPITGTVQ